MPAPTLLQIAQTYLHTLCIDIPSRRVGSDGNRRATDFVAGTMSTFGFEVECPEFDCVDWQTDGATLRAGSESFEVHSSPYSLGCNVNAPLVVISSARELRDAQIAGKAVLLRGDIAKEQIMPKNFPWYNPDHHKRMVALLEERHPAVIIAATSRNPQSVGALYPFPLFEDGDFDIPSVYMKDIDGNLLSTHAGRTVRVQSNATRIPSTGCNVVARKGSGPGKILVCAHIDARIGTPGALDNATGIAIQLLLAELLENYRGNHTIEIAAFNGEDYYASPGQKDYLVRNEGALERLRVAINLDGVGYAGHKTAWSLYECSGELTTTVESAFGLRRGMIQGKPWPQGDHMIFVMNGRPAVALTSDSIVQLERELAHTPSDTPDKVDSERLVEAAECISELVGRLST